MKKTLAMILALVIVAGISVAGTLAYLTAVSGTVTNTFTTGGVGLTLDETDNTQTDGSRTTTGNQYKLIPGGLYAKDPIVQVTAESEACYVFVHVDNGLGDAEVATASGTIEDQIITNRWIKVDGKPGYYYQIVNAATAEAGTNLAVFTQFAISGDLKVGDDAYTALTAANIKITAFATQSAGLTVPQAVALFPTGF